MCSPITVTSHHFRALAVLPLFSILALASTQALAVELPSTAAPGQVEKRVPKEIEPSERIELSLPSPVESQKISEELRARLEKNKFELKSVVIEGATVYGRAALDFAYKNQIGQSISLLDARAIANRITTFYRNHGYILSQAVVPAQDVTEGVLKIRVIEGYISNVTYEGDISGEGERKRLDSYAVKIKELHPVAMADLERYMLLMNDLPGTTITGLIRPANTEFGAADLVLTVNRKTVEGSYTFDNRGSKFLGPWEHTFIGGANSVLGAFDHTQARIMTVDPFKELFLAELEHDEVLDSEGTKISLLASHTRTEPGDYLKQYHIVGDSDLFEAKISHPFMRTRQQSLVARGVLDVHNTGIDISDAPVTRDRLRIARVGATYNFLDTMQGSDSIDTQLSQGMNIFSATDKGDNRSNPNGDSAFTKANFDMSRLQPLPENFSVLTSATGQYSFQALLTDEQFSLGGSDYGRAFDPAEALGDSGLGGKAEVRYDGLVEKPYFDSYQLFTFLDIEEAWIRAAPAGSDNGSVSMSSFGIGSRFKFTDFISSSVEGDVPLIKPRDDQTSYRHSPRIFFTLSAHY